MLTAKEENPLSLPKTRVWGSDHCFPTLTRRTATRSSTAHWGSTLCSYEIAVERLVGKYFPYGQERPSATTDGKEKFATYFRDSETGLDYAQNRYHQPGMGRFMSPDPYATGGPSDPGSWNRYAYVGGDPINYNDSAGLLQENPSPPIQSPGELPGTHHTPGGNGDPQCMILYLAGQGGNPEAEQMFETWCAGGGTGFAPDPGGDPAPPPDPCPGIASLIWDTIRGQGMPGGKSLLTRVIQQITGDPAKFDSHQEQIDGYRNRLRNLKNQWKDNDCDDPDDPPYVTNRWINETDGPTLRKYNQDYLQFVQDTKNVLTGVAGAAAAAAATLEEIEGFLAPFGGTLILF